MKFWRCDVCGAYLKDALARGELKEGRCPNCGGIITEIKSAEALADEAMQNPTEQEAE